MGVLLLFALHNQRLLGFFVPEIPGIEKKSPASSK
jgi:hypothetical protein